MKKQYIKAVDVIAEVLRKWYILVICVILMAVAVPNFKYNNDKKLAESNKKLIEQMKEKDDAADDPRSVRTAAPLCLIIRTNTIRFKIR